MSVKVFPTSIDKMLLNYVTNYSFVLENMNWANKKIESDINIW